MTFSSSESRGSNLDDDVVVVFKVFAVFSGSSLYRRSASLLSDIVSTDFCVLDPSPRTSLDACVASAARYAPNAPPPPENAPSLAAVPAAAGSNLAGAAPPAAASFFPPPPAPPSPSSDVCPECVDDDGPDLSYAESNASSTPPAPARARPSRPAVPPPPTTSTSRRASGLARVHFPGNASPIPPTSSSSTPGAAAAKCRVPFEPGETLYLCVGERRVPADGKGTARGEEKEDEDA